MRRNWKVYIKNESDSPVSVEDIGDYTLDPGEEIDLCDTTRAGQHYPVWTAPIAVFEGKFPASDMYQKVQAGMLSWRREIEVE